MRNLKTVWNRSQWPSLAGGAVFILILGTIIALGSGGVLAALVIFNACCMAMAQPPV